MLVPRFYEDLNVMHDKTMPARTYYIPASVRMNDLVEHRERSDRFQLLNGEWKFQYYNSIYDVTESFYEKGYDVSGFDQVTVPGVWQMDGYDTHQYTNIRYPFPFDPPYVPQDIPCGAYVHNFEYHREKKASKAFLNFEGVDSCFYVWVNGAYAGYSQVPHATSEFDVTDLLNEGENTLAVLVLKWCDGSYLEDQDKFRMSGIFRDVYLLKRPEKTIRDYYITTDVEKDSVVVKLDMHFAEPVETKVTIEDKYGAVVARGETAENGVLELTVLNPVLWNAENPYLYQVILTMPDEVIVDRIGFRTIEIKDKVVYFNGEKIKFRGVNRHDSDPETGFVIDVRQIKKDLMLMKQHNFNAIRSSHYPNAPYFYQMCDEYGFMVIDEADIEAHGPFMLYRKEDTDQNRFHRWNEKIADDPAFKNPTKPIGSFMTKEEADELVREKGYKVIEDSGRGYRRVVASPKPVSIVEIDTIKALVESNHVVIACGGGGIPVFKTGGHHLKGAAAVIDKDFAAEKLAEQLNADCLIILTAVEKVAIHFGTPEQEALSELTPELAEKYIEEGEFPAGSMLPKVQAAVAFTQSGEGRTSLITLLEKAKDGIAGKTGTLIHQ